MIEELSSHPVMTEQLTIKETETELEERYKSCNNQQSSHSCQIFYSREVSHTKKLAKITIHKPATYSITSE